MAESGSAPLPVLGVIEKPALTKPAIRPQRHALAWKIDTFLLTSISV
jgi:hypothetical protein